MSTQVMVVTREPQGPEYIHGMIKGAYRCISVTGEAVAAAFAGLLVRESIQFVCDPMPDDVFDYFVKAEVAEQKLLALYDTASAARYARDPREGLARMMDVSTGNLTESDIALLKRAGINENQNIKDHPFRVCEHRYGFTVFVSTYSIEDADSLARWRAAGVSPQLIAILLEAAATNCILVNFDSDADELDGQGLIEAHREKLLSLGLAA